MDLDGKVAVVTGAGGGLGWYLAEALREAGAVVIAVDVRAGRAITVADVGTEDGRGVVLAEARAAGGLHVLVNNAGGWSAGESQFPDAAPTAWRSAIELNLCAPMALTQLALTDLRAGHGAVVNVSSSAGLETAAYESPEYAAAKAGLVRFTRAVADWQIRYGVRVNCVVPGWIELDRARGELAAMSADERAAVPTLVPPQEVAAQVLRLLRDDSLAGRVVTMLDGDHEPTLLD